MEPLPETDDRTDDPTIGAGEKKKADLYASLRVECLGTREMRYDFSHPSFAPHAKLLQSLAPERVHAETGYRFYGASPALVNAFRRVVCGELRIKALDFPITSIETDEEYIIPDELRLRIRLIPLDQTVPVDTEFHLHTAHPGDGDLYYVKSRELVRRGGGPPAFSSTFRLAELHRDRRLAVPTIKVVEGYGYENAMFRLTDSYKYYYLDYLDVDYMTGQGGYLRKIVKVAELEALMKRIGTKPATIDDKYFGPRPGARVLVIPNRAYRKLLDSRGEARLANYSLIVENPAAPESLVPGDEWLPSYSSTTTQPRDYHFSFRTFGNIEPRLVMPAAAANLVERLNRIATERRVANSAVVVSQQITDTLRVLIRGEDHTIGELLRETVYRLDPGVRLVRKVMEHPSNRTVIIEIRHDEPSKLFDDAVTAAIAAVDAVAAQLR